MKLKSKLTQPSKCLVFFFLSSNPRLIIGTVRFQEKDKNKYEIFS